jgi:hypothetical protein
VACRTERAKRELVRVVRAAGTGELAVDPRGKASGRGAYLCADPACLERGLAEGSLARSLATTIDEPTRQRLKGELEVELEQRKRVVRG